MRAVTICIVGLALELGPDVIGEEVDTGVAPYDAGEGRALQWLRCREQHRLDTVHPLAPAGFRRQLSELRIEAKALGLLRAPAHRHKP